MGLTRVAQMIFFPYTQHTIINSFFHQLRMLKVGSVEALLAGGLFSMPHGTFRAPSGARPLFDATARVRGTKLSGNHQGRCPYLDDGHMQRMGRDFLRYGDRPRTEGVVHGHFHDGIAGRKQCGAGQNKKVSSELSHFEHLIGDSQMNGHLRRITRTG